MPYSDKFGQPCWEKDQVEKCVNIVAQVTREQAPYFLATHSPFKNIRDVKADSLVAEEKVFRDIFSRKGEIRTVVRGKVGTGKSHLIRWLNLRAEYAASKKEDGLEKFKIVMIKRETGSLKSALTQMVSQLGEEFYQHIETIKKSIDQFSAQTARTELVHELAIEINDRWEQRGRKPLARSLAILGETLLSPDYRNWLTRDEGVIARIISRLTESSTPEDREKRIVFTEGELIPRQGVMDPFRTSDEVKGFIDDLQYEPEIAEQSVEVLNMALMDAQRELTGIEGSKLNDIFTAIRKTLHSQGRQLAVFIEDATSASGGLDYDLFQAFEPRSEKGLCRMIALLGMTNQGFNVLPDNEKQRVNFEYDVGENAMKWSTDHEEVARFTARYLNAIRCSTDEIDELAQHRFESDVPISRCGNCPHQKICHKTYGYVVLDEDVKIGLFPFSEVTPYKLLRSLNEEHLRSSPRGLLDRVLFVALNQSYEQFESSTFPNYRNFGVRRQVPAYWTDFEHKYLGGTQWSTDINQNRARFLAEFWFEASFPDELASRLEPYRESLSLPSFSQKTKKIKPPTGPVVIPPKPPTEDKKLIDMLSKLDEWIRGGRLSSDSEFRNLLSTFISKSMRWQDHRGVPVKFASSITKGTKPFQIEGQIQKVAGQLYFLTFDRNEDTRGLLEGLLRYDREGKKSWNFENAELHRRKVYRWLRRNRQRITESLSPQPARLTDDAIRTASHLLGLTAILKNRSPLPKKEPHRRISEIFAPIWEETKRPQVLSKKLNALVYDLETKWGNAKELIISELGVGQGTAAPTDFIDPLPILEALEKFEDKPIIKVPPKEINDSYWKVRFGSVSKLEAHAELSDALIEERNLIEKYLEGFRVFLSDAGFDADDMKKELVEYVRGVVEVIETEKRTLKYYNEEFDNLWKSKRLQNNRDNWGVSVDRAKRLMSCPDDIDILCYEPNYLEEARNDLLTVTKTHLERVEEELNEQEKAVTGAEGSTKDEFLTELYKIVKMLEDK